MAEEEKRFLLEIVTPEKSVFKSDVESVIAPGELGYFQILHNHAPYLCSIRVGNIRIKQHGRNELYATSGGFIEVSENKMSVLAETAEPTKDIDLRRAEEAKRRAEERLEKHEPDTDLGRAEMALARAVNRITVARKAAGG